MQVETLPVIKGSKALIKQLFFNLIHNSLKFLYPEVSCTISISALTSTEDGIEYAYIAIIEDGIGFNEGENEKIFNTFSRLHSKDKYEGIGLGLALSRRIAEKHPWHYHRHRQGK